MSTALSSARRIPLAVASLPTHPSRSRRGWTAMRSSTDATRLVSSKSSAPPPTTTTNAPRQITYSDLTPLGRLIAGTVEVSITTALEFLTGFCGGYFLGTVTDVPRLLFRKVQDETQRSFWQETSGRMSRMHGKSFKWAKTWGGISAAFGGFGCLVKVVRNGREDEWNTVLSSMAAGAYFSRAGR